MKHIQTINLGSLMIASIFSLASCLRTNEDLTQKITLPNSDEIFIPSDFVFEELQGDDSAIGRIKNPNDSVFVLSFDIGDLAGEYVDIDSKNSKRRKSVNEEFWYEEVEKSYINSENCCLYVTFPETGPANFVGLKQYKQLILDIMQTYESKE